MKKRIRINVVHTTAWPVFWKEGPLLFDVAQRKLPRLLNQSYTGFDS